MSAWARTEADGEAPGVVGVVTTGVVGEAGVGAGVVGVDATRIELAAPLVAFPSAFRHRAYTRYVPCAENVWTREATPPTTVIAPSRKPFTYKSHRAIADPESDTDALSVVGAFEPMVTLGMTPTVGKVGVGVTGSDTCTVALAEELFPA